MCYVPCLNSIHRHHTLSRFKRRSWEFTPLMWSHSSRELSWVADTLNTQPTILVAEVNSLHPEDELILREKFSELVLGFWWTNCLVSRIRGTIIERSN